MADTRDLRSLAERAIEMDGKATGTRWTCSSPREDGTAQVYAPSLGPCRMIVAVCETTAQDGPFIAASRESLPALAQGYLDALTRAETAERRLVHLSLCMDRACTHEAHAAATEAARGSHEP